MSPTFTCPSCGAVNSLPDESAGRSVPCPSCGIITSAGSGLPPMQRSPDVQSAEMSPAASGKGRTILGMPVPVFVIVLLAVMFFVVLVCGGILMAVFLPSISAVREAARKNTCRSNQQNIGTAMENYRADHNDTYPAAFTVDKNGQPLHSWRTELLVYAEQGTLSARIALDEPWDSPQNRPSAEITIPLFVCISAPNSSSGEFGRTGDDLGRTDYVAIVGTGMVFQGSKGTRGRNFTDARSSTIVFAETSQPVPWMEPRDLDATKMQFRVNGGPNEIGSSHRGIAHVTMADGSVRALADDTDPEVLRAMLTIAGGEIVEPPWDD